MNLQQTIQISNEAHQWIMINIHMLQDILREKTENIQILLDAV
jgi:hypothetical protein